MCNSRYVVAKAVAGLLVTIGVFGLATASFATAINADINVYGSPSSPTYSGLGAAPDTGTSWFSFNVAKQRGNLYFDGFEMVMRRRVSASLSSQVHALQFLGRRA